MAQQSKRIYDANHSSDPCSTWHPVSPLRYGSFTCRNRGVSFYAIFYYTLPEILW